MQIHSRPVRLARTAATVMVLLPFTSSLAAQRPSPHCAVLCAPTVDLMPALLRSHLFGGPRVQALASGAVHRLPGVSNFEIIMATAAKTRLPRLSVFGSVQWIPNATEQRNPFTMYSAGDLGGPVHANAPTATFGLSASALTPQETGGWFDAALNAADLLSQAARPDDRSAYTHKLDLELFTHLHAFAHLPSNTYIHRVSVFGILDYVASGLPRAGDQVPIGRRYLDSARPTSLIVGLALPITPEVK